MTRRTLRLTGNDVITFLQGLVTNDVTKLDDRNIVYAALLTPQGKYLADFFLVKDGDSVLLDADETQADMLNQRLSMYKLRADVTIAVTNLYVHRGTNSSPPDAHPDPRHPALGWRAYRPQPQTDDSNDWDALYVAHVIPQSGIELTPDTYILEAGFERLNGVDFRKGCFVGQEIVARMKHKTTLRKGLCRVAISGTAPIGTEIHDANQKVAGTLFTQSSGQAIAHLRFDRATGPLTAHEAEISWSGNPPS